MNDSILERISRIYASIDTSEEYDPNKLKATFIQTKKHVVMLQDFRGGLSDAELSNQAHTVIHNIANMRDNLRRWAAHNGQDKTKVDQTVDNCLELQIIMDLSNNEKHGYPPRHGGRSGRCPKLIEITRVMKIRTQAKKRSKIAMILGADGWPKIIGDGTAKAVLGGDVVDNNNNHIGNLYDIAQKAVGAWEILLTDFGLGRVEK